MTELEFCEHWCGKLTILQAVSVESHVEKGTFIGAGKGRGFQAVMPLVEIDGTVYVLASDSRTYPASTVGRELYKARE